MSYLQKIEYRIVPEESFRIKHNCGGCGCKRSFINTKRFRVNANGSRLDVWLIYQCEQCKHTLNVAIYERTRPDRIPKEEYLRFLANDEAFAEEYGRKFSFFKQSRMEVDQEAVTYGLERVGEILQTAQPEAHVGEDLEMVRLDAGTRTGEIPDAFRYSAGLPDAEGVSGRMQILLHNPYGLKLRPEKLTAQVLGLSRSQVKHKLELGELEILQGDNTIQIIIREVGKHALGIGESYSSTHRE